MCKTGRFKEEYQRDSPFAQFKTPGINFLRQLYISTRIGKPALAPAFGLTGRLPLMTFPEHSLAVSS
jgi:hypothetical protein